MWDRIGGYGMLAQLSLKCSVFGLVVGAIGVNRNF
jgi:hypothetical protein